MVYTCTEDIEENGKIFAFTIAPNGELTEIGNVDAGGTSTCYLTIDKDEKNLLAVNYWDSTLVAIPLSKETGEFLGGVKCKYDPKHGHGMNAAKRSTGGVNHSLNNASTIFERQADPHSHALVLDPYIGCIAYVPCLGKDLIREFYYDIGKGSIEMELNFLPSGLCSGHPDGPRYLCFHPRLPIAYVVNELSSTVAVFSVDKDLIRKKYNAYNSNEDMKKFQGMSTLRLIQSISTVPSAFPKSLNTCGRIAIHTSGRYVLVSNRGHQSISILRIYQSGPMVGQLSTVGYFHTRGETPRHFKFDSSGQYLIVANQDSNNLSIFNFNQSSGEIKFTGNEYHVPSPNFICCCPLHDEQVCDVENDICPSDHFQILSPFQNNELKERLSRAKEEVEFLEKELANISNRH